MVLTWGCSYSYWGYYSAGGSKMIETFWSNLAIPAVLFLFSCIIGGGVMLFVTGKLWRYLVICAIAFIVATPFMYLAGQESIQNHSFECSELFGAGTKYVQSNDQDFCVSSFQAIRVVEVDGKLVKVTSDG
jgi:hypothetical protein